MDGQEFFSNVSATYYQETFGDLKTLSSFGRTRRTARVLRTLDRLAKPASVVADIGCGPAQLAAPITAMGHEYIGVDPNPEMYSLTAEKDPFWMAKLVKKVIGGLPASVLAEQ